MYNKYVYITNLIYDFRKWNVFFFISRGSAINAEFI